MTLIGEADRKMLKAAIKHANSEDQIRHRVVPREVIQKWSEKLGELKNEIVEILQEEKEEKQVRHAYYNLYRFHEAVMQLRQAEMELKKGQNIMEHEAEIFSRPARTWFQSAKNKKMSEGE